ncbi:regulator of telomere elongation helicase 1-like isoform X1 [Mytilus galloprovincialis]|uniref:regulator of telomere elongation helicase 1-like isoform X1 n=2 Tax=Mytilus galloprovincialis TaxID=29158 RepID=UPI003F7B3F7F
MPLLNISGVQVSFPFEPYACQVTYMEKVMESLQKNVNGILESPTGTGKTLCLLCSTLAWLESRKAQTELNRQVSIASIMGEQSIQQDVEKLSKSLQSSTGLTWGGSEFAVPKIIYASRTHSQLNQAVQELKRTAYNSVKVSVIGSREQLCIQEQVRKEPNNSNKVHMCRAKVSARTCHMYNRLEDIKKNSDARSLIGNVIDIEDMVTYGEKQRVCPYYLARELKNDADIIFMPYNYLLDPKSRKAHGVELQGNIVIFDEAHNLEKICEDSSSFDLTSTDLATAIEELAKLSEKIYELTKHEDQSLVEMTDSSTMPEPEFTLEDLLRLKATLKDLENKIDEIPVPNNGKGVTKPGMFIFELLRNVSIGFDTKNFLIELLDKIINYVSQDGLTGFSTKGAGLTKVCDILKIIFCRDLSDGGSMQLHMAELAKSYKVHIQKTEPKKFQKITSWATNSSTSDKTGKTLSYWCFSPGHSMVDLMAHGIKCIILTSGTLSPLSSFTLEMQIPFPVTLENPHVIEKHQVWIGTVNKGPDGVTLNSNFETRYTPTYQSSLGNSIVNFARIVPNGLLIFFPSYPVMDKCIEFWKENNIFNRISQYKPVFVEPRGKMDFQDAMFEFYNKINDPSLNGAIFVAVCRGKVSEGLDFADENGRAVVITGLPYPPYMDPRVVLKMQYLDEVKRIPNVKHLTGKEWYRQQASRAVNQAIGRVIRHRQDFGAILLCDTRFSSPDSISQLPIWVRPNVQKCQNFGQALKEITVFFKTAEQKMPATKPKKKIGIKTSPGAYFLPTTSRSAGPTNIAKAGRVSDHVASLKHTKDNSNNYAKLSSQYEGGSKASSSTQEIKRGLLGALTDSECKSPDIDSQGSPFRLPPDKMVYKKQARKKITIKKRGETDSKSSAADILDDVPATVKSNHLQTAESYIAEVKRVLYGDRYKMFSKALVDYKKIGDFQQLTPVLVGVFTEDTELYPFFREFYRFVRPKDKCEYDKLCKSITGTGCGYRPEDSILRKRLQTDNSSNADKRQKTVHTNLSSLPEASSTGKQISVNLPKEVNVSDNNSQSESYSVTKNNLENLPSSSMIKTDYLNQSSEDLFEETEPCSPSRKHDSNVIVKADDITCPSKYPSGYTCECCQKNAERPFEAGCGHICCFPCWRTAFDTDKVCPVCKQPVRRRHLTAKYFAGPELE